MAENPYQPAKLPTASTRPRRWLILLGIFFLAVAVGCVILTGIALLGAFESAQTQANPVPGDLAESIRVATMPMYLGGPIGLLGIVLMVLGMIMRKPTAEQ